MNALFRVLKRFVYGLAGCAAAFGASAAYPEKPITILVGSATGGGIDILARNVGKLMSASLSSPVVVENRAGAAGLIAVEALVKSKPDGYTLLMGTGAVTALPHQQKVSFDPTRDFTPVTQFGASAVYFLVNADYAAHNAIKVTYQAVAKALVDTKKAFLGAMRKKQDESTGLLVAKLRNGEVS